MGDLQGKQRIGYNTWSVEESSMLLELMVDAANRGWRSTNGVLSKQTIEKKILPILNEKLGCQKNYTMYQSRLTWFKQKLNKYSELMQYSSGFGWDPITKKFTASDEVWENYFESHPKQRHLRTDTIADYEDLHLGIGNATATGRNSIADIRGMLKLMEKWERDRENKELENKEVENNNNIWNAIKETPNLDNHTRYKVPAFIHKFGMKDAFLKMSHEKHWEWIKYNVE
ncbi:Uncharacterized protein Adt_36296 [Abeliophyllum distichum]|uniref:Myb/SANT-like domain-containing protein n=1 Tax=Abeliophyllum distichum TaxID=126358 RepID=A0ABD1QH78_9LAMI